MFTVQGLTFIAMLLLFSNLPIMLSDSLLCFVVLPIMLKFRFFKRDTDELIFKQEHYRWFNPNVSF